MKTHGWDDMGTPVPLTQKEISTEAVRKWKENITETKCLGYICSDCANAIGGEWPEHHVATFHNGECSICKHQKGLAAPSDWQLGRDGKIRKISSAEWD